MEQQESLINLWQVKTGFRINCKDKKVVILSRNSLLFLLDRDGEFLVFKTEENVVVKLHRSILEMNKLEKIM